MKKALLPLILVLALLPANATINIESIDLNKAIIYTMETVAIDINFSTTEAKSLTVQLFDNNVFRQELLMDVNSPDGNKVYYKHQFLLTFTEGHHILDANIADSNKVVLDLNSKAFDVIANPIITDQNISWSIIQQYVLPIARSLSECLVEKMDLNVMLSQNSATLKALENDVAIAQDAKNACEVLVNQKATELDATNSARATCEADKATKDSQLANATVQCNTEKTTLQDSEQKVCGDKILLKDEAIQDRETRLSQTNQEKNNMDNIAFVFGVLFLGICSIVAFLYFKGKIKT